MTNEPGTTGAAAASGATTRPSRPFTARAGRVFLDRVVVVLVPVAAIVAWEALVRLDLLPRAVPAPTAVVGEFIQWVFGEAVGPFDLYSGTWLAQMWASTSRVLQGFGLAVVVGVPVGVLIGWSRILDRLFDPTIQLARPIPITAWLPFAIAVFGIGRANALFLIYLGAFYPIVINSTVGARGTSTSLIRAAGMLGASRPQMLIRVVVPSAVPNIVAGMRVGVGIGWTAVIVAEMIAIQAGLGYVLWDAYYQGRMAICVAAMVSVGMLGFLSDWVIKVAGNRIMRWRKASFHG